MIPKREHDSDVAQAGLFGHLAHGRVGVGLARLDVPLRQPVLRHAAPQQHHLSADDDQPAGGAILVQRPVALAIA